MSENQYLNDKSNLHAGHRTRVKKKFIEDGLDSFTDVQTLELLLFYCIPQGDTNETAHALLNKFGSLSAVIDAPYSQLLECDGIGPHTAAYLKMLPAICRRYRLDKITGDNVFEDREKIKRYLTAYYMTQREEQAVLMCLDTKRRLISMHKLQSLSSDLGTAVCARKIAEAALGSRAHSVVLAHNHPSDICEPSEADISLTNEINYALRGVGVNLTEHYIITCEQALGIMEYITENGLYDYTMFD